MMVMVYVLAYNLLNYKFLVYLLISQPMHFTFSLISNYHKIPETIHHLHTFSLNTRMVPYGLVILKNYFLQHPRGIGFTVFGSFPHVILGDYGSNLYKIRIASFALSEKIICHSFVF